MATTPSAPVIAGIDASGHWPAVVDWALTEARVRHRPLVLLHAYDWAVLARYFAERPHGAVQELVHANAVRVRDKALATARGAAPDLDIQARLVDGGPARVLIDASRTAAAVVVGHRGHDGFPGLCVGSVATQVAAHAASPVLVVRPSAGAGPNAGRVVVGVDASPRSAAAVEFAFAEAALRGLGLTAVHVWAGLRTSGAQELLPLVYDANDVQDVQTRALAEALAGFAERYPEVDVRRMLVRGRAAHGLLHAADGCTLLVVGTRGHGGFAGLLLGSVSQAALHHAPCPVAVVRSGAAGAATGAPRAVAARGR